MSYSEYLSKHSFLHFLLRNKYLSLFPRLESGLSSEVYSAQIESLKAYRG
jgi:hypothetical protein